MFRLVLHSTAFDPASSNILRGCMGGGESQRMEGKRPGKTKTVFSEIQARSVGELPIVMPVTELQKPIIDLVDKILVTKKPDASVDTSELEHKIDKLVYKLYGLTEEEIAIVEGK